MSELAGLLGVEKAAMTGLIDRVERHGLVQRVAVPADRRACRIDLTPAGEKEPSLSTRTFWVPSTSWSASCPPPNETTYAEP